MGNVEYSIPYSLTPIPCPFSPNFHKPDAALKDFDHSPADCFYEAGCLTQFFALGYDINRCKVGAYELMRGNPHIANLGAEALERGVEHVGIRGAEPDVVGNEFRAKHLSLGGGKHGEPSRCEINTIGARGGLVVEHYADEIAGICESGMLNYNSRYRGIRARLARTFGL